MTAFVVALHAEAKPLIEHYQLTLTDNKNKIYTNETIALIISGMGPTNAIIATTLLGAMYHPKIFINIGIAGAANNEYSLEDVYLINKIYDIQNNRYYFPDILYDLNLHESDITTSPTPIEESSLIQTNLVDMECSGFFIAASRFVTNERIFAIKVVSDFLVNTILDKEYISKLISLTIKTVDKILSLNISTNTILHEDIQIRLQTIIENLKLTKTQQSQLIDFTKYSVLNSKELDFLTQLENSASTTKDERNKLLRSILNVAH